MIEEIESAYIKDGNVKIKIQDRGELSYCFFWLRENCRCKECYNTETFQRRHDFLELPDDSNPIDVSIKNNVLHIDWNDKHHSEYTSSFLWEYWPSTWRANITRKVYWSGSIVKNEVAYVKRDEFLKSNVALKNFMRSLVKYGVAFVDGVAPTVEDTELVIRRVGPVQHTMFGGTWNFTSDMSRADTAYTTLSLGLHTDGTFFTDAAGLQILHCLKHDGTGGETLLVDGFKCADTLKQLHPEAFDILISTLQVFEYRENGYHHKNTGAIINLDQVTKELKQIRFNNYDRSPHYVGTGKEAMDYYKSYKTFSKLLNCPEAQWKFKLTPGRVVFFDNWRLLHGRVGFTGNRYIGGAYIARADWLSTARVCGIIP